MAGSHFGSKISHPGYRTSSQIDLSFINLDSLFHLSNSTFQLTDYPFTTCSLAVTIESFTISKFALFSSIFY